MSEAPKPLVIFGAGSLARLAYAYFDRDSDHELAAYAVDREFAGSAELNGLPVVPWDELDRHYPPAECSLFVAVGYKHLNRRRAEIFERGLALRYHMPTLVSSRSLVWDDLRIGRNCLVFDGVVAEASVEIGDDVIVWSGAQISHDSSIGDHCFLGPSAVVLGDVTIGSRSFIGGNATVRNSVTVAEDCLVGAGALIKRDTVAGEVYSAEGTSPVPGRDAREAVEL